MNVDLDLQLAIEHPATPSATEIESIITHTLSQPETGFQKENAELTIRVVDETEIQSLNQQYRHKNYITNVLSFPFEQPEGLPEEVLAELDDDFLGDIIICAQKVEDEAEEQHKSSASHWSHMIIHGCLHLLGYDHIEDEEADEMEALEIAIMAKLGYANPYETTE